MKSARFNRLAQETSPYLQQHAHNPVDWYPWGPEALAKAREEDKPILLSIGYSACHWCHVMAHESFEDEATAELMNRLYVNIKVDREERPDIDKIYQLAQQVLNGRSGGWPLTLFLTPGDQMPFFGGTYFPDRPRHGLPSFKDILQHIARFHRERREEIRTQNDSMAEVLKRVYAPAEPGELTPEMLTSMTELSARVFNEQEGGFGRAPKFPHTPQLDLLLRRGTDEPVDADARHMAEFTLRRMAEGGMFDQLAGGFCRYSVDDHWMIPHFEKMLYDNGPLLSVYAEAAVQLDEPAFGNTARAIAHWVMDEMQSPQGGYYSSLDADSEGHEGKFYVWTPDEVRALLPEEDYALFARRFGLDREPNFEGAWHLHGYVPEDTLAQTFAQSADEVRKRLDLSRRTLLAARERRIRPGRDEKILVSWNALMMRGMAIAGRLLNAPEYVESATRALGFIRSTLWQRGRLLATYKDGRAHLSAYLDDHAFLIDAILELLQNRWDTGELSFAEELAQVLLERFQDRQAGGFYFTADDQGDLIERPRGFSDESLPNGNAVAALALARLGWLLARPDYLDAAERTLKAGAKHAAEAPLSHSAFMSAYAEQRATPAIIILRGTPADLAALAPALRGRDRLVFPIPAEAQGLPSGLADKPGGPQPVAYVCRGMSCDPPLMGADAIRAFRT